MMERRDFLRTAGLALAGAVFVPRYERWFQPAASASRAWYATPGTLDSILTRARSGDTVRLATGEYRRTHPLVLPSGLHLSGVPERGMAPPLFRGGGIVMASHSSLSDLHITGGPGYGVRVPFGVDGIRLERVCAWDNAAEGGGLWFHAPSEGDFLCH